MAETSTQHNETNAEATQSFEVNMQEVLFLFPLSWVQVSFPLSQSDSLKASYDFGAFLSNIGESLN